MSKTQDQGKETSCTTAPTTALGDGVALTYQRLLESGCQLLKTEGLKTQQIRNLASALNSWIRVHGYSMARIVGDEWGSGFDQHLLSFSDRSSEKLSPRTLRDRQEQLIRWRRITVALRVADTLPNSFSAALLHALQVSPVSRAQVARECGVTVRQLEYWCSGDGQPRFDVVDVVPKLEAVLELPQGSLLSRLPLARRTRYLRAIQRNDRTTSFTKVRQTQLARTGHFRVPFADPLKQQWRELLAYKTDALRPEATPRNTWRLKPLSSTAIHVLPWMVYDGQVCATAGVQYGFICSYLGWLKLDPPEGRGFDAANVLTLAWLADPTLVVSYAKWRMSLSGARMHNGVDVFLQLVASLLRASTGFIWQRPELLATAPGLRLNSGLQVGAASSTTELWREHCSVARQQILEFQTRARNARGIQQSRDPTERVAAILNDASPLRRLVEFTETLERSPPPTEHHRDYVAWLRDVVLCRLLLSNPLRVTQYATMTYRSDGTGNLVRTGPGQFRLRFSPQDFKNEKGAACKPYDVAVDPSVAPWIERYLVEARPYLVDADKTHRLLLPAVRGPRKEKSFLTAQRLQADYGWTTAGILNRLKVLTSIYVPNCPGFGPHAYRHVIATDHLRRHPGDYLTVATLLHDKLETVLRSYSHLRVEDGLRALSAGIREASADLAAGRQSV